MTRSLQDMSAAKALKCMQEKDARFFSDLPQDTQQVLFPYIWQDRQRLLKIERMHEIHKEKWPVADRYINFIRHEENRYSVQASLTTATTLTPVDPHLLRRDRFRSKWQRYSEEGGQNHVNMQDTIDTGETVVTRDAVDMGDIVEWAEGNLIATDDPQVPLTLCCRGVFDNICGAACGVSLADYISSQLLFYRLTAVFGSLGHQNEDRLYCSWTVELKFRESPRGYFVLEDYLGGLNLYFCGNWKASFAALELLNWLMGKEVPHCFPSQVSFLAGTEAPQGVEDEI